MKRLVMFFIICFLMVMTAGYSQQPMSPEEIMARSVARHGGDALTDWKTMVIKGEVNQPDGNIRFRGEYLLYAQKPDKLRVERDLTKFERGRFFLSYIYNNGQGWILRNLIPSYRKEYAKLLKRWLDSCDGIAYFANSADTLTLKLEETVNGKQAYVITAVIGDDTTTLYIDKESFYLIQEEYDNVKRLYSEFKKFGNTVHATHIDEITTGRRTMEINFIYNTIEYNVPIDQELFEEDKPKSAVY